jgi:hypothetical protein
MRPFRTSEQKYIREHYGCISISQIASHLGRRKSVVMAHIKTMGLELTTEQRERMRALSKFKAGQPSYNKGKAGKPNSTSFKAGNKPANAMHDGAITIRHKQGEKPYKYYRVGASKWVLLHRYIWEQANGPIPQQNVIRFIDGDTMNTDLQNLQLITLAEHAKLNQNREKSSESLKHRWKVRKAIAKHRAEFPALFE